MESHKEWFSCLEKPEEPGVAETGEDTPHTIEHVGEPPPKPCRTEGEADERLACPNNKKEPCVGWTDCRRSDAIPVHTPEVLH